MCGCLAGREIRELRVHMKTQSPTLMPGYLRGLQKYLKRDLPANLDAARRLGLHAVKMKMEILDLARVHEEAVLIFISHQEKQGLAASVIRRGNVFFGEAIAAIEETHRAARETNVRLGATVKELAKTNQQLNQEIRQRKGVEESLKASKLRTSNLLGRSRQMQEELRHLSRQLLLIQEEERKKISRELHDVIAQTLTGIDLRLGALKTLSDGNTTVMYRKISATQKLVGKSVEMVQRFARDLRPAALDDLGLIPALQSHLHDFMEKTGIRVDLTVFAAVEERSIAIRTVLYRVVQESLTNVERYAKASKVQINIHLEKDRVCLEVCDDGRGFSVEGPMRQGRKRLGLLGMRERVEMLRGSFEIDSAPGHPTTVRVQIPGSKARSRKAGPGKISATLSKDP